MNLPEKSDITVYDIVNFLNELREADVELVNLLLRCSVECGVKMSTHPVLQTPIEPDGDGIYSVTLLDIVNSMLLKYGDNVVAMDTEPDDPVMIKQFKVQRKWW